jgi:hypothetical protein
MLLTLLSITPMHAASERAALCETPPGSSDVEGNGDHPADRTVEGRKSETSTNARGKLARRELKRLRSQRNIRWL